MPAINSMVKQVIKDYGELEGIVVDIGCGTAIFAIELCKKTQLQLYALEKEKADMEKTRIIEDKAGYWVEIKK